MDDLLHSAIKMLSIGLQHAFEEEEEFEEWMGLFYYKQAMLENGVNDVSELVEDSFYNMYDEVMSTLKKSNYAKCCRFITYFCLHVQWIVTTSYRINFIN